MVALVPKVGWVEIVSLSPFQWRFLPQDEEMEAPVEVSKRRHQGADRRGR